MRRIRPRQRREKAISGKMGNSAGIKRPARVGGGGSRFGGIADQFRFGGWEVAEALSEGVHSGRLPRGGAGALPSVRPRGPSPASAGSRSATISHFLGETLGRTATFGRSRMAGCLLRMNSAGRSRRYDTRRLHVALLAVCSLGWGSTSSRCDRALAGLERASDGCQRQVLGASAVCRLRKVVGAARSNCMTN